MAVRIREVRDAIKGTAVDIDGGAYFDAIAASPARNLQVLPMDGMTFRCLPEETWDLYLQWSRIDRLKYITEMFDCDDFALCMKAEIARRFRLNSCIFVIDYSGGHAYNMLGTVKDDGGVWFTIIEPQTDGKVIVGEKMSATEMYALEHGYLIV